MKGSYKVYNANKGEWVNLDTSAGYDNVKVKIENNKLYVSYDYGTENSWEYVGDVGGDIDISGKADKNYVDETFAKKEEVPICKVFDDVGMAVSGLTVDNGYVELKGEVESGSSSTNGGSVKAYEGTVKISAWDDGLLESDNFANTITLDREGLRYNDCEVVTMDEHGSIGRKLLVGNLVIEDGEPFMWSFQGTLPHDGHNDGYYSITATLDSQDTEMRGFLGADYYAYKFIVTECSSTDEYEHSSEQWNGKELWFPAYLIDDQYSDEGTPLELVDGKTNIVQVDSSATFEFEDKLYYIEGCFIKYVPYALKKSTNMTLNGHKVVTKDILDNTKNDILSKCVQKGTLTLLHNDDVDEYGYHSTSIVRVDPGSVTTSSSLANPDYTYGLKSVITPNSLNVTATNDEGDEESLTEIFKIDTNGDVWILMNNTLVKLQDLLK